jgi:nucleotide-binding universal stress UspA family protein
VITHILVPLDGSALAEAVLPAAAAMAAGFGGRIVLLHIVEERAPETIHGQPHLTEGDRAQAYLDEVARRPIFQGHAVEVHVHLPKAGDVAESIVAHTQELGADLVVLSTHGKGGLRSLLFGSIAMRVLQRGTTPILLVNPAAAGDAPRFLCRTILVPLDGTPAHEPALAVAATLGRAWRAALRLVIVVPTVGTLSGDEAAAGLFMPLTKRALLNLAERGADEYVQRLAEKLTVEGVSSRGYVSRGEPAASVVEAANRVGADLVVVASHAKGALDAFWSGSLTPKLIETLGRPLLLVRAATEDAARASADASSIWEDV